MDGERIIARTIVNGRATVTTRECVRPGMIVGVHPCLETTVSGIDDIDSREPYRLYVNQHAAKIGHEIVCEEIGRYLVEMKWLADGINTALIGGAL